MDRSYQPVRLGSTDQMQVSGFLRDGSGHPACQLVCQKDVGIMWVPQLC